MILIKLAYKRVQQLIDVEIILPCSKSTTFVSIPAWRPGRYELQKYASKIRDFVALDDFNNALSFRKKDRNTWEIITNSTTKLKLQYSFWATTADAGGSWVDTEMTYLNWINFCMYDADLLLEPIEIESSISTEIACSLPHIGSILKAINYRELFDSPLLSSTTLQKVTYTVQNTLFHCWFSGTFDYAIEKLLPIYKSFTEAQLKAMVNFPFNEYHFLNIILPYKFYHGVEHGSSTVITLGPGHEFSSADFIDKLIGISSHELFHAWNIVKIRPKELQPYQLEKENYFITGYVAEGFTTYLGDYFLVQSGFWTTDMYLKELSAQFQHHLDNQGYLHSSLVASSFDLWVDGYQVTMPNRKVSIYDKGAVVACLLDWKLFNDSKGKNDLLTLMKSLWQKTNEKGSYEHDDIVRLAVELSDDSTELFLNEALFGQTDLLKYTHNFASSVGLGVRIIPNSINIERFWGIRITETASYLQITKIDETMPAHHLLGVNEYIINCVGNETFSEADFLELVIHNGIHTRNVMIPKSLKNGFDKIEFYIIDENKWQNKIVSKRL